MDRTYLADADSPRRQAGKPATGPPDNSECVMNALHNPRLAAALLALDSAVLDSCLPTRRGSRP